MQSRLRDHSGLASEDSTRIVLLDPLRLGFMMDSIPRTTLGRSNQLNFGKARKRRRTLGLISQWENQGSCRARLRRERREKSEGEEEEEEETDDKKSSGLDRAKSRSVEQRNATVAGVNSRSRCPSCSGLSAYQRDVSTNRSAFVP